MSKNYGFSLIELIIAVLILSILAITAYFKWSNSAVNLYTQAALLANDVRYAQNLSMTQYQRFRLVITATNTYQIQDGAGNPVAKPMDSSATTTLASGITFGSPTGITNKIVFDTDGTPYADALATPLISGVTIPLIANGQTANITIDSTTGRITP